MDALTKPTRGRQDLAMDPGHRHFSWVGAVFWAGVLAWLLFMAFRTQRRRSRS